MKKFKLFAASLGLMTLAACSNTDDVFNGAEELAQAQLDENAIKFGTYLGQSTQTRAGYEGSINTDVLKDAGKANGFGVFAYYTNANTYAQYQKAGASLYMDESTRTFTTNSANFMYNQQVTWNSTEWKYEPIKYWPNEFNNSDVDDQDNDGNSNPAWGGTQYNGTLGNGGNVSFFAYAPYVAVTANTGIPTGATTDGITAMTANDATGDPKITYKMAADGDVVDLLWGTLDGTNTNVNNAGNLGVTGTSTSSAPVNAGQYVNELLAPYTTNADLTKQRTDGKVGFAFKHALAKIGGSNITGASGSSVNGLMIVLDIDNDGKESGGVRESWTNTSTNDSWRTIVTVNSITITNDLDGDGSISDSGTKGDEQIVTGGVFNLATGKWTPDAASNVKYVHSITKDASTSVEGSKAATLSSAIVETAGPTVGSVATFFAKSADKTGVTETPQNVYQNEANPLVFIPGTAPVLRFTIDYYVRTFDLNLAKKYSEVRQVISKKVTFPELKLNKQYSMLIHLGLTGVKFTASVSDWSVAGDDNNNGVIDGTETLEVEDVYLPINVSSLLVTYSADPTTKFGSNSTGNIFTISAANYFDGEESKPVAVSELTVTPAASWATWSQPTAAVTANTTFATRSTKINISKSPYICDDAVTITQYGRIPADDATITLTTSDFATVSNAAHADVAYSISSATIDKYFETNNTGAKTGVEQTGTITLTNGTDITLNKAIFIDNYGNKVSWITAGEGTYSVDANTSGAARTATVAFVVNGKVVKTNTVISQNA